MTKKSFVTVFRVIPLLILLCLLLAGCNCKHEWNAATCTAPKTCFLCQTTDGNALGHTWSDASCEVPKTCSVCNTTEGEASSHTWVEATCQAPKTCSVCSKTEGEPADHTWVEATCQAPKTCSICKTTEGEALDHTFSEPTVTKAATCLEKGVLTTVCTSCNSVRIDEESPIKTTHTLQSTVEKNASCTQAGSKTLACTICTYKKTETIPATGHNYVGATCLQTGSCSACGVTSPLGDHTFTVLSDQGDRAPTLASRRKVKCMLCKLEKTEYYCNGQVYDLNAINAELIAYAESLGFTMTSYEEFKQLRQRYPYQYNNNRGYTYDVVSPYLANGGPAHFIERQKAAIAKLYDECIARNITEPTVYLTVYYGESMSIKVFYQGKVYQGSGSFGATIFPTS